MKYFIVFIITFISLNSYSQNIIQVTNNGDGNNTSNQSDCAFMINGICSSEDIGGVSLERFHREIIPGQENAPWPNYRGYAELKNYNNFTVTVLIKVAFEYKDNYQEETYQVVIPSNEVRDVQIKKGNGTGYYTLLGMIVRRLKN